MQTRTSETVSLLPLPSLTPFTLYLLTVNYGIYKSLAAN